MSRSRSARKTTIFVLETGRPISIADRSLPPIA